MFTAVVSALGRPTTMYSLPCTTGKSTVSLVMCAPSCSYGVGVACQRSDQALATASAAMPGMGPSPCGRPSAGLAEAPAGAVPAEPRVTGALVVGVGSGFAAGLQPAANVPTASAAST